MAKRTKKSIEGNVLTINFANGAKEYNASELSQEIRERLMMHGLSQLLGDTYAAEADAERYSVHADARWSALASGEWSNRGESVDYSDRLEELRASLEGTSGLVRKIIEKEVRAIEKKLAKRNKAS